MALAAAKTVLGEACEVRDVSFEQMLLLDEHSPVSASASVTAPGVAEFVVETYQGGERTRRAKAVLHAADDAAVNHDISALLAAHPTAFDGKELRETFSKTGIQYGAAFSGLATSYTDEGSPNTILSAVALPGPLRSQQGGYGVHPALLDACFHSVVAHPNVRRASTVNIMLPLSVRKVRAYDSARHAHYCYTTVIRADADAIEADLEILDENGAVLLSLTGLLLGTAASEKATADRVLSERLLAIEWEQGELPEADHVDAGSWLLISTADDSSVPGNGLDDALKSAGAECTTMVWPERRDHEANAELLASYLSEQAFAGVVVLTGSTNADVDGETGVRGGDRVRHMVRIARELAEAPGEPPRLYVVTRNAQKVAAEDVPTLEHGGLRGLVRSIGMEHPRLTATQIDIDDATVAEQVVHQLLKRSPEDETAWRNGQWYTARLCPAPLRADERRSTTIDNERDGMRLQVRTPGDLESAELVAYDRVPPGLGQIEVAVSASSINFADVLVAFGRYPSFDGQLPPLGAEFAGVVTAVGPDVTTHRIGDRVGGVSASGCWGNFVTCEAALTTTLPESLEDHEAAAVGMAYATAWHSLQDLARITSGDKVLIHSATGGVGQAAIAIARAAGADIFATAGNDERRQLLRDWGIEHVYDSRSTEFAEQIRRDTDGYGVDIVLNSVTGAAQRAGLELLAFGGRFIEIGKRDIYGDTRLGLFPFRRNLAFYAVDLALMTMTHPDRIHDLLEKVYRLTADGSLPLPEITRYPLAEAATAIRRMGGAQHTGKLVLEIPRTGPSPVALPPKQVPVYRGDGAYIITGGLGGLGLFLAEKLAEAGCGRIVLSSRSQPTVKAHEIVELIRSTGADIVVECGDIAAAGTADRLVAAAKATGLPVRGVLHAAAVVEDATLTNITDDLVERDWAPKVYGAWNLHQATASEPLDWFCCFSSAAALVGSPGQAAYAAANSWVDAFMHWRRAQGLLSSSIAWGAWAEIGRGTVLAEGDAAILPDEGAFAFDAILRYDRVYTGYAPILGAPWLTAFAQRSPFAELFKSAGQSPAEGRKLRAELAALPREEWPSHLRRLISEQVGLLLRRSIDPDRPLSEYGLDSLGNLELRTRIEAETGVRISSVGVSTVRALADNLCETLAADDGAPATTAPR